MDIGREEKRKKEGRTHQTYDCCEQRRGFCRRAEGLMRQLLSPKSKVQVLEQGKRKQNDTAGRVL